MNNKLTAIQAREMQRTVRLTRFNKYRLQARDLDSPIVPDALSPDNLLPLSVLEDGMLVQIPAWARVLPDDVLTVSWDGEVIHTHTVEDPAAETWPYSFTLTPEHLTTDGTHRLDYVVTASSGATSESNSTAIKIDREPPEHGNVPPSLVFTDEVNTHGITLEYLSVHDDKVIATVPGYATMQSGQIVHPFWGATALDSVTVAQVDVYVNRIEITIPGEVIRAEGEGRLQAHYYLTNRAGFDGQQSTPTSVNVLLTPAPTNLLPPDVPLADDELIDLEDADTGVTIEIKAYGNAQTGDLVIAKWGNKTLVPISVVEGIFPMEVPVPRGSVISEGSVEVSYQIERSNIFFTAPSITVTVDVDTVGPEDPDPETPENEALTPPTVTGNSGKENELTPEDYDHDATVTVPVYENVKLGEIVTVYWGHPPATALAPYIVVGDDLTNDNFPVFTVSQTLVDSSPNDDAWPVYYTLSRAEAAQPPANPVLSPTTLVNIHMVGPGGPDGLDRALFPDASSNGWLLTAQVQDGLKVHIDVYENMLAGDVITLNWHAFSSTNAADGTEIDDSDYQSSSVVGAPELANGVDFVVPYEGKVDAIAGASPYAQGAGQVIYTVTQAGSDYNSPAAAVKIDLGAP